jgi:hypothetical protein
MDQAGDTWRSHGDITSDAAVVVGGRFDALEVAHAHPTETATDLGDAELGDAVAELAVLRRRLAAVEAAVVGRFDRCPVNGLRRSRPEDGVRDRPWP